MENKKKITCSKLILIVSYIAAALVSAVVIYGAFRGIEMMYVATIGGLAWAEVASANIWYFKKAEKENVIKIALGLSKEMGQELDVNRLVDKL